MYIRLTEQHLYLLQSYKFSGYFPPNGQRSDKDRGKNVFLTLFLEFNCTSKTVKQDTNLFQSRLQTFCFQLLMPRTGGAAKSSGRSSPGKTIKRRRGITGAALIPGQLPPPRLTHRRETHFPTRSKPVHLLDVHQVVFAYVGN